MDAKVLIERLERNGTVLHSLMAGLGPEEITWKPAPGSWSILEICAHLLDEEREDFRTRLLIALTEQGTKWPPIDPQGWVKARAYAERDFEETLGTFVFERTVSIGRLHELTSADWDTAYDHPRGPLRAGDLLAAWVAHDLLHLRQITHRLWQYTGVMSSPFHSTYAGDW